MHVWVSRPFSRRLDGCVRMSGLGHRAVRGSVVTERNRLRGSRTACILICYRLHKVPCGDHPNMVAAGRRGASRIPRRCFCLHRGPFAAAGAPKFARCFALPAPTYAGAWRGNWISRWLTLMLCCRIGTPWSVAPGSDLSDSW